MPAALSWSLLNSLVSLVRVVGTLLLEPQLGEDGPPPPEQPQFNQDALRQCEGIIDSFRRGEISKARAQLGLNRALTAAQAATGASEDAFDAAYTSFAAALDDHERQIQVAAQQGQRGQPPPGPEDPALPAGHAPPPAGRQNDPYPWTPEGIIHSALNPIANHGDETHRILCLLLSDPKAARRSVLMARNVPEFPDSEWTNLLGGKVVNLDVIVSGLFSTVLEDQRTEILAGGVELRFGHNEPIRTVRDMGTWTVAFSKLETAFLFIYPHRRAELTVYRDFINSMFAAVSSDFHGRIIEFDKACRRRLASTPKPPVLGPASLHRPQDGAR
ncbi:C3H1-type domain-containing protein [Mycena chlorophos]|uniref:C3H1-type domain-containing protein n=1 Tax=Mycena chlorophos TaxID=658473 RepID=A0A8H6TKD9_MYCCL|nr:C3H1-type domain-containing protein [Mycena chlorophos]